MSASTTTSGLMLSKETVTRLFEEAQTQFPEESCGVFIRESDGAVKAHAVANIHADPHNNFLMDPYGLLELCYDGNPSGVVGLYHSHCGKLPHPSTADLALIELTKMPHLIVSVGRERLSLWASWLHHSLQYGHLEEFPFYGR